MTQIPDPSWKCDPDIVADESYDDRYTDDEYDFDEPDEDEDEETALILITQLPQITENLRALKERWEQKAADAAALVCTDDSIQTIKAMRPEMRKEYDEADTQRKAVKDRYMAAWNEVESTWKECVAEPFKRADASYKATVDGFEAELKARCMDELNTWFQELVYSVNLAGFITLDQALGIGRIKVSLADAKSTSKKRVKDALAEVVAGVEDAVRNIDGMDDAAEIMEEYRRSFDLGHAISVVQGRKRRVEAEREAAEARRSAQERAQAAMDKVGAVATPVAVEPPKAPEKVYERITFTVLNVTKTQALKIREFLKQEGIKYE